MGKRSRFALGLIGAALIVLVPLCTALLFFRMGPHGKRLDPPFIGPCGPPVGYSDLAWSPDGRQISFALRFPGGRDEIYVMDATTLRQTRLTDRASPAGPAVAWSPDGIQIAFVSKIDDDFEIYVMNRDGTKQSRLTDARGYDGLPVWSPDSQRIAFISHRYGVSELFVMDKDGANQTRLTFNVATIEDAPAWSPDGIHIALSTAGGAAVYIVDARDGTQTQLSLSADSTRPSWSPDGSHLAFTAPLNGAIGLYVMNSGGSDLAGLTAARSIISTPVWSPDGQSIIFDARQSADANIYRIHIDGSGQTVLAGGNGDDITPAVSPDGKSILFLSDRDGSAFDIYRMDADPRGTGSGSHQTRLTDNPGKQKCLRWPF